MTLPSLSSYAHPAAPGSGEPAAAVPQKNAPCLPGLTSMCFSPPAAAATASVRDTGKALKSNDTADIWRRIAGDLKVLQQRADELVASTPTDAGVGQAGEGDRRLRTWLKAKADEKVWAYTWCGGVYQFVCRRASFNCACARACVCACLRARECSYMCMSIYAWHARAYPAILLLPGCFLACCGLCYYYAYSLWPPASAINRYVSMPAHATAGKRAGPHGGRVRCGFTAGNPSKPSIRPCHWHYVCSAPRSPATSATEDVGGSRCKNTE